MQSTQNPRLIKARLLDGRLVLYRDLCPGDIFQAVNGAGQLVHPVDHSPCMGVFAVCDYQPEQLPNGDYEVALHWGRLQDLMPPRREMH